MLTMITMIGAMPIVSAARLKLVDCSVYSRPRHPCAGVGNKDHKCTYQQDFVRGNSGKIKGHMDVYEFHPAPPVALYLRDHPALGGNENVDGLFVRGDNDKAEVVMVSGGLRYYLPIYYRSVATHLGTDVPKYFITAIRYGTTYHWNIRKTSNNSILDARILLKAYGTDEGMSRSNAFAFASKYVTPIRNQKDIDAICQRFRTISISVWRGEISKMQRDEHVGELKSLLLPGIDELGEQFRKENERRREELRKKLQKRFPLSPETKHDLRNSTTLSKIAITELFKKEFKFCGWTGQNYGVHIPLPYYRTVSEETIGEIYEKRMLTTHKALGKPSKKFSYHKGGFTCSDFARCFLGAVSEEQHDDKTETPFAIAECWSGSHAFNVMVTHDKRILFFEPQSGKLLTKEAIKEKQKEDLYEVQFAKF